MKLNFWRNDRAQRRADGDALTAAYPVGFRPRHCAGETCIHDHADQQPTPTWPARQSVESAAS